MVARPSQKEGMTGKKAANLLLDNSWGEIGIPGIITSDQGTQFVSQFFGTLCARLGIRMAYSQAHRPQANGRAEVAGRVVQDLLRRLFLDGEVNWVEALPRALRIHHDTLDHYLGMSPMKPFLDGLELWEGYPGTTKWSVRKLRNFSKEWKKMMRELPTKKV